MAYIRLIRLNSWVKNSFIIIPLFFSSELFYIEKLIIAAKIIIGFSFVASFVYIVNDIFDLEFDKNHPKKKYRPIAAGEISINEAVFVGIFFFVLGLIIIFIHSPSAFYLSVFYFSINILYSYQLKHIPIIDLMIVAFGFVIRLLIGSFSLDVYLSQWIIIMVFLLSLYIVITKRRDDVIQYKKNNRKNRKVVNQYSVAFMDNSINVISSVLLVAYLLFITSNDIIVKYQNNNLLYLTFLPVLMGVLRYSYITYVLNKTGNPIDVLFYDRYLQIILFLWFFIFYLIIYSTI